MRIQMKVFSLTTLWKNEMKKIVLKRKAARIRVKSESKATWHFGYLLFFFFPSTSLCCLLTSMHVSVHTQACMQLLMFMCTHSRMCEYTFVHTLVHSHSHTHPHENTLIVVHTSTLHAYSHYAHSFAYSQGYLYSHAYTLAYLHSLMSHTVPAPPPPHTHSQPRIHPGLLAAQWARPYYSYFFVRWYVNFSKTTKLVGTVCTFILQMRKQIQRGFCCLRSPREWKEEALNLDHLTPQVPFCIQGLCSHSFPNWLTPFLEVRFCPVYPALNFSQSVFLGEHFDVIMILQIWFLGVSSPDGDS